MTKNKITIVIADDHPLIRLGLCNIINKHKQYKLLGEFDNGQSVLDFLFHTQTDIIILDIEMPLLNGFEVCKIIRKNNLETKVLFLTMLNQESFYHKAHQLGANGFLLKSSVTDELIIAIDKIMEGEFYSGNNLSEELSRTHDAPLNDETIKQLIKLLSSTEKNVLGLIAMNLSSKQIGEKLFSSELTVKSHRQNIIRKLKLSRDQYGLTKFALKYRDYLI
ncbi:MAG: response regulator [Sphingobacteriaceae bacterium]